MFHLRNREQGLPKPCHPQFSPPYQPNRKKKNWLSDNISTHSPFPQCKLVSLSANYTTTSDSYQLNLKFEANCQIICQNMLQKSIQLGYLSSLRDHVQKSKAKSLFRPEVLSFLRIILPKIVSPVNVEKSDRGHLLEKTKTKNEKFNILISRSSLTFCFRHSGKDFFYFPPTLPALPSS